MGSPRVNGAREVKNTLIALLCSVTMPPSDGIGWHVIELAGYLLRRGQDVVVITRGLHRRGSELISGVKVVRTKYLPVYPFHGILNSLDVRAALDEGINPDVVGLHFPYVSWPRSRAPVAATFHSPSRPMLVRGSAQSGIVALGSIITLMAEHQVAMNAGAILTTNDSLRRILEARYGRPCQVIGNGVDADFFKPENYARGSTNTVTFIGRFSYEKGLHDFLLMASKVSMLRPDVRFRLVGHGPLLDSALDMISRMNLESSTRIDGRITSRGEILEVYRSASVVVLPSYSEGRPTVLLEAMASGVPVVAYDIPPIREVVEDGVTGSLASTGDCDMLARKVIDILEDEGSAATLASNARRAVLEKHTWDRVGREYLNVLTNVSSGLD